MSFDLLVSLSRGVSDIHAALSAVPLPIQLIENVCDSTEKVRQLAQNWFEAAIMPGIFKTVPPAEVIRSESSRTQRIVKKSANEDILNELKAKNILFPVLAQPALPIQIPRLARSTILESTDSDFMHAFVEDHLRPYLTGKITAKDENKDRPALITLFLPLLREKFPQVTSTDEVIQQRLLEAYVLEAAYGFNIQKGCCIDPDSSADVQDVKQLCAALKHALRIDFKGRSFSSMEIEELAEDALRIFFRGHDFKIPEENSPCVQR